MKPPLAAVLALTLVAAANADTNLIPRTVSGMDRAESLDGVRYLRGGQNVNDAPEQYYRIIENNPYRGRGCLQLNTVGDWHYGMAFFAEADHAFEKGDRYVASAYVRSDEPLTVSIYVFTDDGELKPIDTLRETYGLEPGGWRQIHSQARLSADAPRGSVLIRVHAANQNARHTLYVDEVRLEPGQFPTPSRRGDDAGPEGRSEAGERTGGAPVGVPERRAA